MSPYLVPMKAPQSRICVLLFVSAFLCCRLLSAQGNGSITGKVTDGKGVPVPAASIQLSTLDRDQAAELLTDVDGSFRIESLPPGTYQLTVEIVGFVKFTKTGISLAANSSQPLEIRLEPLPRPPAGSLPQAAAKERVQAQEAPAFQTAEVTDLPGLGEFQQNLLLTEGDASAISPRQDNLLLVSGNSATLDAGNMNDPSFRRQLMDTARQMGFDLQQFSPGGDARGFGGAPGAVGNAGASGPLAGGGPGGGFGFGGMGGRGRGPGFRQPKIEGNVTEVFSNSALNARNYSLTGETLPKPVQIQNNFTLTLGGVLPFVKPQTNSQRGFMGRGGGQPGWTLSYSGSRNRSALDVLTTVPTDLERAGDFSQTYLQSLVLDPATGQRNLITQPVRLYMNPNDPSSGFTKISSVNPIAAQLLQFIPRANLPCAATMPCVNNYSLERSLPSSSDQVTANVTGLRLTPKDNFGATYSFRRGDSLNAAIFPGLDTTRNNFAQNIGISGSHFFQPRVIASWRITLNRTHIESSNGFAYSQNVEGALGITGVSQDPINWGPPTLSFTDYGNVALAAPALNNNQTFTISGGFFKIGTKHSLQAGADFSVAQRNSQSDNNGRGTYNFTGSATVLLDAQGRQVPGTGYDFADFLLGLPYSTSRRYVDPLVNPYGNAIYLRNRAWNMYAMDNWRANSNLTINYGLRYEYTGPSFEKYNRLVSLDETQDFKAVAQVFPDQTGSLSGQYYPRSLVYPDRNNLAPRVGIAWRPTAHSPFVIRAGYGIGYNAGGYWSIVAQLVNQAPFAITQNLVTNRSNPLSLQEGFPNNPDLTVLSTYAIDPNYKHAYAQQWNLDVQTQISRLYVLTLGYTGTKGTGLDVLRAPSSQASTGSYFIYQTNGGNLIYHGLNVLLTRRFSHGFNMTNSYTFSKSIDDSSGTVAQNDSDLDAERALSNQDQRHRFQSNVTYELPMGQNRLLFSSASTKVLNFVSGWTISGQVTLASGLPLTARYASSNGSVLGAALYNSLRPDAVGDPSLARDQRTVSQFFNTAAFAIPSGPYGNAGRNTITGPGTCLVNLVIRKSFRLDENNRRADFSWQVQNLFNHPNWAGVSTTINSLNFGQVTSVRAMRSMTMNLRIRF
jgi:hypothetical protein